MYLAVNSMNILEKRILPFKIPILQFLKIHKVNGGRFLGKVKGSPLFIRHNKRAVSGS
jgi:hypothetical protein